MAERLKIESVSGDAGSLYFKKTSQMISPVAFAIAAVPVAMYLMMIGRLRCSRRPLVTTGWRDAATLGIAIMGLVAIGPMQLFFPTYAAARFEGWVWGMLLGLYLLSLLLIVLGCRPRLIVYGMDEHGFARSLEAAARRVDEQSNWHGHILSMPSARMQLAAEPTGSHGVQSAVTVSGPAAAEPWMQLEREMVKQCQGEKAVHRPWPGLGLVLTGAILLGLSVWMVTADPAAALNELRDFFTR